MKLLLFLLTAALLVSPVMNCLMVISDCPCGDILDLAYLRDDMIYTEHRGCIRNMTCPNIRDTHVSSWMDSSEIPRPSDVSTEPGYDLFFFETDPYSNNPPGVFVDLFSYFGMICEDKTWFVTKYPMGASYTLDNGDSKTIGGPDEYNGKKSMVYMYMCTMDRHG